MEGRARRGCTDVAEPLQGSMHPMTSKAPLPAGGHGAVALWPEYRAKLQDDAWRKLETEENKSLVRSSILLTSASKLCCLLCALAG